MDGIQVITSRQNPLVKHVCGLADKKNRGESGCFRFDGIKLFSEALASSVEIVYVIYREHPDDRVVSLIERAIDEGRVQMDALRCVSDSVFEKLSDERSPEGIITVARMMSSLHTAEGEIGKGERILIAESLRDPGNLGTVMRSCFALGIDRLVLTNDCADIYNPKTQRAAMGAMFRLHTLSVSGQELGALIFRLRAQGRRVYATALSMDSQSIGEIELSAGDCFVIGNEGHGLSESTVDACTAPVIIPMREGAESLNAAAAATICIWETVRAK